MRQGRTAAEMMVFARYVMFSEVYWHHAVRCATAMLQRAFYLLHDILDLDLLFRQTEADLIATMRQVAGRGPAGELLDSLFGPERRLYKRFAQYSAFEMPDQYHRLTRRPYNWLVVCAENLAELLQREWGMDVRAHEVLFDAPPVKLEVQFNVEIFFPKADCFRPLADVSPVVRTLAREQFDDYVKRVRVFVHPRLRSELARLRDRDALIREAVEMSD
jgi:HD superfamily phosphohydrolase